MKKKPLVVTAWIVGIILAIVAVLVFVVLPDSFGASDEELKELQDTDVDSLMNIDIPEAPICD